MSQNEKQLRAASSLLDFEAADYFELDPTELRLFGSRNTDWICGGVRSFDECDGRRLAQVNRMGSKEEKKGQSGRTIRTQTKCVKKKREDLTAAESGPFGCNSKEVTDSRAIASRQQAHPTDRSRTMRHSSKTQVPSNLNRPRNSKQCERNLTRLFDSHSKTDQKARRESRERLGDHNQQFVGSSTASTSSLPSISSSPSVSPSLVCPHISLDDLLRVRTDSKSPKSATRQRSPHTIGLCARCQTNAPPNVHSPLSPMYRSSRKSFTFNECRRKRVDCGRKQSPSKRSRSTSGQLNDSLNSLSMAESASSLPSAMAGELPAKVAIKRGYSDGTQIKSYMRSRATESKREDSLDHCLEPREFRRMQMSPTLRHSVEFIRNNSIESARVVRVFKNGEPFDKPLRICITRGEFSTLEHLLDHINGRQLIAFGARFLFHLDGQIVYSVHELKHKSAYVVSGVRQFHYKSAAILKDRLKREEEAEANLQRRKQIISQRSSELYEVHPSEEQQNECADESNTERRETDLKQKSVATKQPVRSTGSQRAPNKRPAASRADEAIVEQGTHKRISSNSSMARIDAANERRHMNESDNYDSLEVFVDESERFGEERVSEKSLGRKSKKSTVTRAKSELSGLQPKRKKNVTFIDTGRGSSPTIYTNESSIELNCHLKESEEQMQQPTRKPSLKALSTSEIGIQVSDSLEGHLIDLPIALPERDTIESEKESTGKTPMRSQQLRSSGHKQNGRAENGRTRAQRGPVGKGKGKIMAFSERQLSMDEMSQLTDMDRGDHHNDSKHVANNPPEVRIQLEPNMPNSDEENLDVTESRQASEKSAIDAPEVVEHSLDDKYVDEEADRSEDWQYPGGSESSATPVERPVSQNDANESVRARVTTPTPSLSTGGDNNSLTMSYESPNLMGGDGSESTDAPLRAGQSFDKSELRKLPPKQVIDVRGKMCEGIDPPARNFKLEWVGGFTINDLYPDNSTTLLRAPSLTPSSSPTALDQSVSSPTNQMGELLTPSKSKSPPIEFKPSERFNNWICHSHLHDELVYPAGALIVLWSRWTDSQRYYSKHTANVSCLSLASLDLDIAASAQVGDSAERVQPVIHLWSLTNLSTLLIVGEDQFRGRKIISLKVRHSTSIGCELSVAARDEKYLWLYAMHLDSSEVKPPKQSVESKPDDRGPKSSLTVSKVNKLLQGLQLPLLLTNLTEDTSQAVRPLDKPEPAKEGESKSGEQKSAKRAKLKPTSDENATAAKTGDRNELLVSFGRKHFQIWSNEKRQNTLRALQADKKESKFVEMISKSNCLARLSPSEFLLGDLNGNIALLTVQLSAAQAQSTSGPRNALGTGKSPTRKVQKYSVETVLLVEPSKSPQNYPIAVTCLARISGNLFASADSNCNVRFWQLQRTKIDSTNQFATVGCKQVSCISLPSDLGFICTIISAKYDRKNAFVEFYVVSTSNAILFGHVKLGAMLQKDNNNEQNSSDILANSSLSVVYEGHETSVSGLVADISAESHPMRSPTPDPISDAAIYFTCSLDCKVCKWSKQKLVWKSMLPSACASIAVHPSGSVLAVGSIDGTVYILDKFSGLLISYFPLTPVRINCLGYARDGSLLAAGCLNGSIFMLPVYEKGLKYRKVSIFQSPHPVVSLQFSSDNKYILTSVTHGSYQELILWDLPNFRYMRDNVKLAADKLEWFDSICSGSEDVRATWENANIEASGQATGATETANRKPQRFSRQPTESSTKTPATVINLSCHRLIRDATGARLSGSIANNASSNSQPEPMDSNFVIASDTRGYLRLFRYPCNNIDQGFYAVRTTSDPMNCCRFLAKPVRSQEEVPVAETSVEQTYFVTTSLDGNICIWSLD